MVFIDTLHNKKSKLYLIMYCSLTAVYNRTKSKISTAGPRKKKLAFFFVVE